MHRLGWARLATVAVLESSELLAWTRREWDEAVHPASADVASRVDKLERALSEIGVIVMRGW